MRRLALLSLSLIGCSGAASSGGAVLVDDGREAPPPRRASPAAVVQLAAAGNHSCALHADGTVTCWGENSFGELGSPGGLAHPHEERDMRGDIRVRAARLAAPIVGAVELATGPTRTCARTNNGVWCWGSPPGPPERIAGVDDAVQITHRCARTATGAVLCWDDLLAADPVSGVDAAIDLDGDAVRTCAIDATGDVACWGRGEVPVRVNVPGAVEVAVGTLVCVRRLDGQVLCGKWPAQLQPVLVLDDVDAIDAEDSSACARRTNGVVVCGVLGAAAFGTVWAVGDKEDEVAVGGSHTCVRRGARDVRCRGDNRYAQLGVGWQFAQTEPVVVKGVDDAIDVHVGKRFSCVRRRNGKVSCWGYAGWGGGNPVPTDVYRGDGAVQLTGRSEICVRDASGTVRCGTWYELGQVLAVHAKDVAIGPHGAAIHERDMVASFNTPLPLGEPITDEQGQRVRTVPVADAVAVAVGDTETCWVRATGAVECIGVPGRRTIPGLGRVTALAMAGEAACALVADGTVWCWGKGAAGQLGTDAEEQPTPGRVSGLDRVVQVSAGEETFCARRDDGTVRCWGSNRTGVIATSDARAVPRPVAIAGVADAIDVAVGHHACVVHRRGAVSCWGLAEDAQVGVTIPSYTADLVPVGW